MAFAASTSTDMMVKKYWLTLNCVRKTSLRETCVFAAKARICGQSMPTPVPTYMGYCNITSSLRGGGQSGRGAGWLRRNSMSRRRRSRTRPRRSPEASEREREREATAAAYVRNVSRTFH